MIAVLSPAKTLDFESSLPDIAPTKPRFAGDADRLAAAAAKLSRKRLSDLMHISDKLAQLNVDRFRGFTEQDERPALFAFAGDVYTGFEVQSLDRPAIDFAQGHVRILSGLYGLLRPFDNIRPYRLEMGTKWAPGRPKNLYEFWQRRVAEALADDIEGDGSGAVLNLASKEYWTAVAGKLPASVRVIDVDFRDPGPDGPRIISFYAKKARGMMARWMCEHRITDIEALKGFDSDGYRYDAETSTDNHWQFVRA